MESALIFVEYKNRILSLLYADNRLKKVGVHSEYNDDMGAVYIGKVKNVVPSIEACFVEYKQDTIGFLSLKDSKYAKILNRDNSGKLTAGDEIIVQVETEGIKSKAVGLTCNLSFRGNYAVVTTGKQGIGFSHKLKADKVIRIKDWLEQSGVPEELKKEVAGMIIRTNASEVGEKETLLEEINGLLMEKKKVFQIASHRTCFSCLFQPMKSYLAEVRDLYQNEFNKIVTDIPEVFEELKKNFGSTKQIELYTDKLITLSRLYSVHTQIKEALAERVWLKSGAYLIIQPTEALTVIDVNSGKIQKKHPGDDIYYQINQEAAKEIALQLKLRNISGIILIDFINQNKKEQDEELLKYLSRLVKEDSVKTNVVDMTPLGLVEVTRKKGYRSLREQLAE